MKEIFGARATYILYNFIRTVKKDLEGKKVILPANICPIVPVTLMKAGINYLFFDISTETRSLMKEEVLDAIANEPVGGIVYVRTYGDVSYEEDFFQKIKEIDQDIYLIDDRCLCIPSFDSSIISDFADLTLYSTGYSKFVDIGHGGFGYLNPEIDYKEFPITFDEQDVVELDKEVRIKLTRGESFSLTKHKDNWIENNFKYDVDTYKKIIKEKIPEVKKHKKELNSIYIKYLAEDIVLKNSAHNWRFNIICDDKDKILDAIFEEGLFASSHYQSLSKIFGDKLSKNASELHANIINLFNDFRFDSEKAKKVCSIINEKL